MKLNAKRNGGPSEEIKLGLKEDWRALAAELHAEQVGRDPAELVVGRLVARFLDAPVGVKAAVQEIMRRVGK